jgi:oligopeptide transport system substrate-binding protein
MRACCRGQETSDVVLVSLRKGHRWQGQLLTWAKAPFNDLRTRQAFALALDRDRLAQLLGLIPTNYIVPTGMAGYDPTPVGPDGMTNTTGNVALARQPLQAYADERCGGQFSRCPPVFVPAGLPCAGIELTHLAATQAAVLMWQQAFPGYPVTAGSDFCGILPDSAAPAWLPQAFVAGWNADYADPQDWLSWQFGPTPGNWGFVNVPAANALMAEADQALDPGHRTELYNQAEQLLVTNVASIPVGQGQAYDAVRPAVAGFALTELGYPSLAQVMTIELMKR